MILLLGGTSETGAIATGLAERGHSVLVSTATDEPLDVGTHPRIQRRSGRLDDGGMLALVRARRVTAIVDAAHPYASAVHRTARRVAESAGIPHIVFCRPASSCRAPHLHEVADHDEAAEIAFSFGRAVLLTTGSSVLAPYTAASRRTGLPLAARVLARPESLRLCREAGLSEACIIAARGPFTVEQNRQHIRRFGIGVLVTKDSGDAGGVQAKLDAARLEGCQVVMIRRPDLAALGAIADIPTLLARLSRPPTLTSPAV